MIDPRHKSAADTVRAALRKLSRGRNRLNPKRIQARLMTESKLDSVKLKEGLDALRDAGEVASASWDDYLGIPLAQLTLNLEPEPEEHPEHVVLWRSLVDKSTLPESARTTLREPKVASKMAGMGPEDMRRLLEGLGALHTSREARALPVYEASARWLLGSSKILSELGAAATRKLGIDPAEFAPPPRYLALAGNPNPKAFTLVENPHSFEAAVRADARLESAWACSYGFGFSMDQRYGGLLVSNLTNEVYFESHTILVRAGDPPALKDLLACERLYFWGDLDLEGLRIYQELKKRFPNIRLSPLYGPMAEILAAGGGHPYVKLVGKDGQRPPAAGDPEVDRLAALCRERGLDQEAVDPCTEWSRLG
ncbi:DUF2220 domain-containing protein [Desulfovibrio aminophilus]|nr:Wadjet anti-phage system protein JetD domain-containing protein [Desulfovibrio aminophilus]MCM0754217.1 DUF2220 domain-containing protein [Desulfovibrio aminophilus]